MPLRFTRRPLMKGNTDDSVDAQPSIRGQVRRDNATLTFPGLLIPANLTIEIDGGVPITVNFTGLDINTLIDDINAALIGVGTAEDSGGYIKILSNTTGAPASVRIAASGGASDTARLLGLPVAPDPLAFVQGGDATPTPPGIAEANPMGTAFAATGEDLTSRVLNRSLDALAYNSDTLQHSLNRELAFPMVIDVDPTDPVWDPAGGRLVEVAGAYTQVDLSALSTVDPRMVDRIYLGTGVNNNSTLNEIADFFGVTDADGVEIIVGGRAVRIAAVTHGERVAGAPNFPDEVSPPTSPVPDVAVWVPLDGGNLLGVDFPKTGTLPIDTVLYRSAVEVLGHSFSADGVGPRDKATLAGASNSPFLHDGDYEVESLIADDTLMLRSFADGDRGELNPSAVPLGNVTVSSGGEFSEDVWFTFEPPIPSGTQLRLVCGGGYDLSTLPAEYMLTLMLGEGEQVDDLVQKVIREMKGPLVDSTDDFTADPFAHSIPGGATYAGESDVSMELLWRRITLQGAYDGQGRGGGGGYFVNVDWNPPEWNNLTPAVPLQGNVIATGTGGTVLANEQFQAVGFNFTLDNVGHIVRIRSAGGPLLQNQDYVIIDYIDSENVVLEPGENNPVILMGGNYNFEVIEEKFDGLTAAHTTHVIQDPNFGRLGYVHEEDRTETVRFGHHMLGVREVTTHDDPAVPDALDVISLPAGAFIVGTNGITVPFDPGTTSNIRTILDTAGPSGCAPSLTQTLLKITESRVVDGWYLLSSVDSAVQRLFLMNFDGTFPVWPAGVDPDNTARMHLYLPTQGYTEFHQISGAKVGASQRVANVFFDDAHEWEFTLPSATPGHKGLGVHLGVIGVDWRGDSAGLIGALNIGFGHSLSGAVESTGFIVDALAWRPGGGIRSFSMGANTGQAVDSLTGTATVAYRGGVAGWFTSISSAMDMAATEADQGMAGTALFVNAGWKDPGLVVIGSERLGPVKEAGGNLNPNPLLAQVPHIGGVSQIFSKAAIVADQISNWSMLQSGTMQLRGAIYQEHPKLWAGSDPVPPGHKAPVSHIGGLYTEMSAMVNMTHGHMTYSIPGQADPGKAVYKDPPFSTVVTGAGNWEQHGFRYYDSVNVENDHADLGSFTRSWYLGRLGQPGTLLPRAQGAAGERPTYRGAAGGGSQGDDPVVGFELGNGMFGCFAFGPDFTTSRSTRSSGFVQFVKGASFGDHSSLGLEDVLEDPATYVGQQILLAEKEPGEYADKNHNGIFTIINWEVLPDGTGYRAEVLCLDIVTLQPKILVDNTECWMSVLGSRWHFGNVDIESFTALGTWQEYQAGEAQLGYDKFKDLSLLGGTSRLFQEGFTKRDVPGKTKQGLTHAPTWMLSDYAAGMGDLEALGPLGSDWEDIGDLVDLQAARPPIANEGWHNVDEPITKAQVEGLWQTDWNINKSPWVFRCVLGAGIGATDFGITTDFDDSDNDVDLGGGGVPAGAIMLHWKGPGVTDDPPEQIYAYTPIQQRIRRHHFRLRVRLLLRHVGHTTPGWFAKTIKVALVDRITGTPASHPATRLICPEQEFSNLTNGLTHQVDLTFESMDDLRELTVDAFDQENGLKYKGAGAATPPHFENDPLTSVFLRIKVGETQWPSPTQEGEFIKLFIYRCQVDSEAQTIHHGALLNEGPIYSNSFNLSSEGMDYKTYGPADAGPFGESGWGDSVPLNSLLYPLPPQGVKCPDPTWPTFVNEGPVNENRGPIVGPATSIVDAYPNRLDGSTILGVGDPEPCEDILPASFYWHRGAHDACFYFVDTRYRPGMQVAAGTTHRIPSPVGHTIRLDPPHGSRLSGVHVGVSILPGTLMTNAGGLSSGANPQWGVYNDYECADGELGPVAPKTEGYILELVRYSFYPTEANVQRWAGSDPLDPASWPFGFSETIFCLPVDLPAYAAGPTDQVHEWNCAGSANQAYNVASEKFILSKIDIEAQMAGSGQKYDRLYVDRRQFSYALVIKAWGEGSPWRGAHWFASETTPVGLGNSGLVERFGFSHKDLSWGQGYYENPSSTLIRSPMTKFKFKGATLSCSYSRINP